MQNSEAAEPTATRRANLRHDTKETRNADVPAGDIAPRRDSTPNATRRLSRPAKSGSFAENRVLARIAAVRKTERTVTESSDGPSSPRHARRRSSSSPVPWVSPFSALLNPEAARLQKQAEELRMSEEQRESTLTLFARLEDELEDLSLEHIRLIELWPREIIEFLRINRLLYDDMQHLNVKYTFFFDEPVRDAAWQVVEYCAQHPDEKNDTRWSEGFIHSDQIIEDGYWDHVLREDNCYMDQFSTRIRSPDEAKHYSLKKWIEHLIQKNIVTDSRAILFTMLYNVKNGYACIDNFIRTFLEQLEELKERDIAVLSIPTTVVEIRDQIAEYCTLLDKILKDTNIQGSSRPKDAFLPRSSPRTPRRTAAHDSTEPREAVKPPEASSPGLVGRIMNFLTLSSPGSIPNASTEARNSGGGANSNSSIAREPQLDATVEPVVEKPVAEKSVVKKSVVEKPVAEKSVAEKPVVEKSVAEKPVVEKPVVEKQAMTTSSIIPIETMSITGAHGEHTTIPTIAEVVETTVTEVKSGTITPSPDSPRLLTSPRETRRIFSRSRRNTEVGLEGDALKCKVRAVITAYLDHMRVTSHVFSHFCLRAAIFSECFGVDQIQGITAVSLEREFARSTAQERAKAKAFYDHQCAALRLRKELAPIQTRTLSGPEIAAVMERIRAVKLQYKKLSQETFETDEKT